VTGETELNESKDTSVISKGASISTHRLRILLVVILVNLTVQAWFGDTVNLFVTTGTAPSVGFSIGAIISLIMSFGPILIWHAFEGLALLVLSLVAIGLALAWSKKRSVRVSAIIGSIMIISAVYGGLSFVASGYTDAGSSAQMGGSFLGAYAFYFMALYFTK